MPDRSPQLDTEVDGAPVVWAREHEFTVGGIEFALATFGRNGRRRRPGSATDALPICKTRKQTEVYIELVATVAPSRAVELGIKAGGSTALLALLARPSKLVAVDIAEQPVDALEAFLDARGLRDTVRPYYGVDQGDRRRLARIVKEEFGADPIDLVIDDASHLPTPTKASFEVLFPRLRPGGLFVIEDWSWEHTIVTKLLRAVYLDEPFVRVPRSDLVDGVEMFGVPRESVAALRAGEFLSDLVAEIIVAKADGDPAIGTVSIAPLNVDIRRGPAGDPDSDVATALGGAAPRHALQLGPTEAGLDRQLAEAGVRHLVVVDQRPPDGGADTAVATTHLPLDATTAPPAAIVRQLGDAEFDLVIDTTRSDEARRRALASMLLARVAPGGSYLLHSWSQLVPAAPDAAEGPRWRRLPRLMHEIVLAVAEWDDAIDEVRLTDRWLAVRPGSRRPPGESFDLSQLYHDHYGSLGRL